MHKQPNDSNAPRDARRAELAKIHIAKKDLGIDDPTYRVILRDVGRVAGDPPSSSNLTPGGRGRVLAHFEALGWKPKHKGVRPADERAGYIAKIRKQLDAADRDEEYAIAILARQAGPGSPLRLEWATPAQLRKVVQALAKDAKRHGRRV